jgi:Uma2 family endonuclease
MTFTYPVPQSDPPLSPRLTLPTMYDLPSEDPEEPGLPDEFHDLQPQLLSRTLRLSGYPADRIFTGTDLNLYYDVSHSRWHKRPDWFLVVNVNRLYEQTDLRSSYVIWQEGVSPVVVVEFLSPGTEREDLGRFADGNVDSEPLEEPSNGADQRPSPPGKFEVYEKILRIPYYIVFNRRDARLRFFQLMGTEYQEQQVAEGSPQVWIETLGIGLGVWEGCFEGVPHRWLRWCDGEGEWLLTDTELAEAEAAQAQAEAQQAQAEVQQAQAEAQATKNQLRQVVVNLLQSGMAIAQISQFTGLSEEEINTLS